MVLLPVLISIWRRRWLILRRLVCMRRWRDVIRPSILRLCVTLCSVLIILMVLSILRRLRLVLRSTLWRRLGLMVVRR